MQMKSNPRRCEDIKDAHLRGNTIPPGLRRSCTFCAHFAWFLVLTALAHGFGRKMTFYDDIYPFYPLQRTPFIFSGSLLAVILVFLTLLAILLLIVPGIRGRSRILWTFRIIISLFIGVVIVVLNFTCDWAEGSLKANTTYKSFSNVVVTAEVGLHVGLYGINITLRGDPVVQFNEIINYNEMFTWSGVIGDDYSDALERGLPNPILYIAEKFTLNSPCSLIYQYQFSGRFASATLWTAFCCWILANILFSMPVILYAGFMMVATAAFIFFSLASFSTIYNLSQCTFSIGAESFQTEYSHSFWLGVATGLLCAVIGIIVILLDYLIPEKMREAFSVGVDEYDDNMCSVSEGYLNNSFLEGVSLEGVTVKGMSNGPQKTTTLTKL
ncbi:dual oxidase maturation factor 1 isoform X1 [Clarias gariepinus]|uniref:dual oxidase maturation factor 1 isoform X1 n=1 Tax=Clarias gariepinus TaxID=13013 RepID=UPI00234DCF40|nr:dual oxidase maturation factor 1 isoform X1 [Clarias gariepinus]